MMKDAIRLDGKVAIVTGAARSLGLDISKRLHAEGWAVALLDRDGDTATAEAEALDPSGESAIGLSLDVLEAEAVAPAFARVAETLGPPEALVNNAGVYPDHALLDMDVSDWDAVIGINLRGTFLCTQAFGRMRRDADLAGGAIVNFASAAAYSARVGVSHYSASKAGIVMFTKSCAQELAPLGLRVNAVAPGLIEVRDDHQHRPGQARRQRTGEKRRLHESRTDHDERRRSTAFAHANSAYIGRIVSIHNGGVGVPNLERFAKPNPLIDDFST